MNAEKHKTLVKYGIIIPFAAAAIPLFLVKSENKFKYCMLFGISAFLIVSAVVVITAPPKAKTIKATEED